jgi:hypothetical protein
MTREWECWDCGHIFEYEKRPDICPKCMNVQMMNKKAFFIELPQTRKPGPEYYNEEERSLYPAYGIDKLLLIKQ